MRDACADDHKPSNAETCGATMTAARSPLGAKLVELRTWSGLTIVAVAKQCGCCEKHMIRMEKGTKRPSARLLARLADVLDCDIKELEQLAAQHDRHQSCGPECNHDGEMRKGGDPTLVYQECAHYDDCLTRVAQRHPNAQAAHCPPKCSRYERMPRYIRVLLEGGRTGNSNWDSTDPLEPDDSTDIETTPVPLAKAHVRLPLSRKRLFGAAQCACSKCAAGRERKPA